MPYTELHAHSAYSFLDGASQPEELAATAARHGHAAFALTDHDSLSGSMEFAQAAAAAGVRAIHGAEVTLDTLAGASGTGDERHLTLLVRDAQGWRNLCRLLTRAHAQTRDGPRRDALAPSVTLDDVETHHEGLVCLSGCPTRGVRDEPTMRRLLAIFGGDALRVELQRPFSRHDRALNRGLAGLAGRLGLPTVATGNVHAHTIERARLQDAFVAIREHTTLDASEPLRRGNHAHVLALPEAMAARFTDHPEAVAETTRLADTLRFDLTSDLGYRYPGAEDADGARTLAEACHASFEARYPLGSSRRDEAAARLEEELALIDTLGLSGFFVLHRDMLELAREVACEVRGGAAARNLLPPGRGRGSSVSSIVCYLTGLSHVDPIANELLLGRFLNDEITSLPDIDLDFPRDVREVLIPRVHERYGHDRSALVAAFPTYRSRGAIRELGKALGLPPGEIERVARGSEGFSARNVGRDLDVALGEGRRTGRWAWLATLCEEAHGLPRHLSQHSGGMIVATRPLVDCVPLVPAAMEGRQIAQWDKDSCADAGFLKIDLLGLGMLSAVERCVEHIAAHRGEQIDLSRIPFDDPATYECIQNADTTGVFQIESRAQMGSLRRTRPENLDDLTIQVAIVRPGPIVGGAVNPYIERRQRLREEPGFEIPFLHPSLIPALHDTLGTIIFQDQVIEVAQAFAGFSPGEAEGLRRAMSRKRSAEAIEAHHASFVQGAMAKHPDVTEELAERVFTMVAGFSGFGFPKAHGAAFGLLAYQSTWLRVHYGPEFLCALLEEQPMGFYPSDALVHEAQRRGIAVLAPEVNASEAECEVVEHEGALAVRLGLGYVQGIRAEEVRELVAARHANGPFRSLEDLASRAGSGRDALERLAWAGACDELAGGDRRIALWRLGVAAPGTSTRLRGPAEEGRAMHCPSSADPRSHDDATGSGHAGRAVQLPLPLELPEAPALEALPAWESMVADYASTGLTTGTHPLGLMRDGLRGRGARSIGDLGRMRHGEMVLLGGLVVARQRPGTAKGVAFLLLEDEGGTVNIVVPPQIYERDRLVVRTEPLMLVEGRLERHASAGGAINVLARTLSRLEVPGPVAAEVKDFSMLDALELERRRTADDLAATGTDDFRAVAPAIQSFASGRRR